MPEEAIVYIVDDDSSVRTALARLLRSAGLRCQAFPSADEFLRAERRAGPQCLVLDLRLPGTNGLELQRQLAGVERPIPIIFLSGHGDIPVTVRAMKAGASEFLTKPVRDRELLEAIKKALESDRETQRTLIEDARLRSRYDDLTPREREVMQLVVSGLLNKQVAAELGISEKTVKVHRAQVMHKMRAGSLAELVRMADHMPAGARPS
ncbi:MAG TPA: response regulator transcription factor [Vicinamibacterales bacterium]|nr:response regulator transcription factor [Vicinamibacterales bacterium]